MSQHDEPCPFCTPPGAQAGWKRFFSLDNRYLAPVFITCILLAGHLSFGILESYQRTLLAIVTSIAAGTGAGPDLLRQVAATSPAPTSPASASASWFARRPSGPTRCAARSRSRRNMCCA